jgi:hypothetical protein
MLAERKVTETASFMEQNFPFKGNTHSAGVYISRFMELEISLVR